jgi:hypothetical protein
LLLGLFPAAPGKSHGHSYGMILYVPYCFIPPSVFIIWSFFPAGGWFFDIKKSIRTKRMEKEKNQEQCDPGRMSRFLQNGEPFFRTCSISDTGTRVKREACGVFAHEIL